MVLQCKGSVTLLCSIFYLDYVMSLTLTELRVPVHVPLGIRAHLLCRWALSSTDVLYSVKWYKDGKEFFRHVPRDDEPLKKFLLPGVDVEEFNSSASVLILAPAVMSTGGRYRCEVSGERPHFQTVSEYADMFVVDLPSHGLNILGVSSQYHVGGHVNVTCVSDQIKPAMKLAWYINGELVSLIEDLSVYAEDTEATNRLRIEFTIVETLVGTLKFQCFATIASVYWKSIQKSAIVTETREHIQDTVILKDGTVLVISTNAKSGCKGIKEQYFLTDLSFIFLCFLYLNIMSIYNLTD